MWWGSVPDEEPDYGGSSGPLSEEDEDEADASGPLSVPADRPQRGCGWDRFVGSQRSPLTRILPHHIVSRMTAPMADDAECTLEVVSALSGQSLCSLLLPGSRSVLDVKRRLQADLGVGIFCQRLLLGQAGRPLEDREVLASLAPRRQVAGEPLDALVLSLLRLSHVKTDLDANRRLLHAARPRLQRGGA